MPTTTLAGGPVKATVTLRGGGQTLTTVLPNLVDLPPSAVVRGFGCGVVTPAQPRIAWQVAALNGVQVVHPAWTPSPDSYPAYVRTVRFRTITDSQGRPLSTKGAVTITSGTGASTSFAIGEEVIGELYD